MKKTRMATLLMIASAAVVAPANAPAQLAGKFIVTPYVGAYVPSADLVQTSLAAQGVSAAISARHRSSLAFGTTGSFWMTARRGSAESSTAALRVTCARSE